MVVHQKDSYRPNEMLVCENMVNSEKGVGSSIDWATINSAIDDIIWVGVGVRN